MQDLITAAMSTLRELRPERAIIAGVTHEEAGLLPARWGYFALYGHHVPSSSLCGQY